MINAKKLMVAAAAVALGTGLVLSTSLTAHADPSGIGVTQNTAGEAGYYANDNGHTRFRDVSADLTVTNQIKNLDGATAANPGAAGVELCDPNSGQAAQLGVVYYGGKFVVAYSHGPLLTGSDPCIMSGLVDPVPSNFLLQLFTINPGDHLHFEIFWQPNGHHHGFFFNACDTTQDICRQANVPTGFLNLYEAGIGAVTNGPALTAPALNPLVTFTRTSFNYYSSTKAWGSVFVPAHWELKRADMVNSSDQVVMSSNGDMDGGGTTFPLFNGSTSA